MRRLAAGLGALAIVAGTSVVLASPAQAATLTDPTYNPSNRTLTATASRGFAESITLTITGPSGSSQPGSRSGVDPASVTVNHSGITRNGTYTATVTSSQAGGGRSKPFLVAEPPATPTGVTATGGDVGVATVTWNDNIEPDLTGYSVLEGGQTVASKTGACGGTCRTTLTGLAPGSHTFVVVAIRSNGAGGSLTTASAGAPVTVAAPAPPTTEPPVFGGPTSGPPTTPPPPGTTPSTTSDPNGDNDGDGQPNGVDDTPGTPKPTASGSPGASVTPSVSPSVAPVLLPTTPRRGTTSFGGFSGFGTALSVPGLKLGAAPTIAGGTPTVPDGTYDPQLAYDSEIRETTITSTKGGGNALGPIGNVVDSEQLMRTLAAALILLLAGAHLRRWLADASDAR